jgi:hypothetical protein
MRTLEFAIWERAQTSSLRRQLYSSPDAVPVAGRFDSAAGGCAASKSPARTAARPGARMTGWRYDSVSDIEWSMKFTSENFSERFEREARIVAALNHPHICMYVARCRSELSGDGVH